MEEGDPVRGSVRIFRRDFLRLVTVPAAWIVIIGMAFVPALYAWFNVWGSGRCSSYVADPRGRGQQGRVRGWTGHRQRWRFAVESAAAE